MAGKKRTVEKVMAAAGDLFLEKGFEKTTAQEIMDNSCVSKGTIFYHFKTKEDILAAVLNRQFELAEDKMQKRLGELKGMPAKEKLTRLLESSFDDEDLNELILINMRVQSPRIVVENMRGCINRTAAVIAGVIKEGKTDGSLAAQFPDEAAEVFLLLYNVWCDPLTLPCSTERLRRRVTFLQHTMKLYGADIISDVFVERYLKFLQRSL